MMKEVMGNWMDGDAMAQRRKFLASWLLTDRILGKGRRTSSPRLLPELQICCLNIWLDKGPCNPSTTVSIATIER